MKQRPAGRPASSERIIRDIKRKTRKQYSAEEKIRHPVLVSPDTGSKIQYPAHAGEVLVDGAR